MTDHDTLIEIEPLLRELGWWEDDLIHSEYCSATRWILRAAGSQEIEIEQEHALAIVTQRAEKELGKKDWYPSYTWGMYYPSLSTKIEIKGGPAFSLADALRVEIGRKSNGD